ncbi:MAG: hypothetical protein QG577_1221, partial [Thermodesulfobacteriota bacterium]|nr:hypothetical protein [Thermodesulfobacteriota bacterium]
RITSLTSTTARQRIKIVSPEVCSHGLPDLLNAVDQGEFFDNWSAEYRVLILDGVMPCFSERVDHKQVMRLLGKCRNLSLCLINVDSRGQVGIPIPSGQIDTVLTAQVLSQFKPSLIIQVGFEKARNLPMGKTDTFHLELVEEENGALRFEETAVEGYQKARLLALSANSRKQVEIAKELGVNQSTVSRWQDEALNKSLIAKDDRGKTILTEAGRRVLAKWGLPNKI